MKFSKGDKTHTGVTESAGYELYSATINFQLFRRTLWECRIKGWRSESRELRLVLYQSYMEFVRGLYEFYLAIAKWEYGNTKLPSDVKADWVMVDAAQRLVNFYRPLRQHYDPRFNEPVPQEFGFHFRQLRNRVTHADYRTMTPDLENQTVSPSAFYKRFDIYVTLMLQHPQLAWGEEHFQNTYEWRAVDDFISGLKTI